MQQPWFRQIGRGQCMKASPAGHSTCADTVILQASAFLLSLSNSLCVAATGYSPSGEASFWEDDVPSILRPGQRAINDPEVRMRRLELSSPSEALPIWLEDHDAAEEQTWHPRPEARQGRHRSVRSSEYRSRPSSHLVPELPESTPAGARSFHRAVSSPPFYGYDEAISPLELSSPSGLVRSQSHMPSAETRHRIENRRNPSTRASRPWEDYETLATPPRQRPRARSAELGVRDTDFHLFVAATSGLPSPNLETGWEHTGLQVARTFPSSDRTPQPHSALPYSSAQPLPQALHSVLSDPSWDFTPSDDELPDYEQSQAEAERHKRKAAARRAAELEASWALARLRGVD